MTLFMWRTGENWRSDEIIPPRYHQERSGMVFLGSVSFSAAWLQAFDPLFTKIMTKKEKKREGLNRSSVFNGELWHVCKAEGGSCPGSAWQKFPWLDVLESACSRRWCYWGFVLQKTEKQLMCRVSSGPVPFSAWSTTLRNAKKLLANVFYGDVRIGVFPCLSTLRFEKERSFSAGLHWSGDWTMPKKRQSREFINGNAWKSRGGLK